MQFFSDTQGENRHTDMLITVLCTSARGKVTSKVDLPIVFVFFALMQLKCNIFFRWRISATQSSFIFILSHCFFFVSASFYFVLAHFYFRFVEMFFFVLKQKLAETKKKNI